MTARVYVNLLEGSSAFKKKQPPTLYVAGVARQSCCPSGACAAPYRIVASAQWHRSVTRMQETSDSTGIVIYDILCNAYIYIYNVFIYTYIMYLYIYIYIYIWDIYIYTYEIYMIYIYIYTSVVTQKAVTEVSKIGSLFLFFFEWLQWLQCHWLSITSPQTAGCSVV